MIDNLDKKVRLNKPVALIGMMGSGKTTIGKSLAKKLAWQFVDTDIVIQAKTGQTIPQIFEEHGEDSFREFEEQTLKEMIADHEPKVIATGGGIVKSFKNLNLLKGRTHLIWLKAEPEILYERIKEDTNRPLLQNSNPLQTLKSLYDSRKDLYAQAHVAIQTEPADLNRVLNDILSALSSLENQDT